MKAVVQLFVCVLLAWTIGWFALAAIDQPDRDISLPPKPTSQTVEMFLLWLPLAIAIAISGNAHDPSQLGVWIGLAIQWTTIGVGLFAIARLVGRLIRKRKSVPRNA